MKISQAYRADDQLQFVWLDLAETQDILSMWYQNHVVHKRAKLDEKCAFQRAYSWCILIDLQGKKLHFKTGGGDGLRQADLYINVVQKRIELKNMKAVHVNIILYRQYVLCSAVVNIVYFEIQHIFALEGSMDVHPKIDFPIQQ